MCPKIIRMYNIGLTYLGHWYFFFVCYDRCFDTNAMVNAVYSY